MEPSIRIRKLFALRIQTNCSQECVILLEYNNTNNARDKSSIIMMQTCAHTIYIYLLISYVDIANLFINPQ